MTVYFLAPLFCLPGCLSVGMIAIPGSNMLTGADGFQLVNQSNNPSVSNTVLMSHGTNPSISIPGVTNPMGSAVSSTGAVNPSPASGTGSGHHGPKSKSKSSKHAQEQNLNEEEKDAIVMQNVKNILSLQHTWNRVCVCSVLIPTYRFNNCSVSFLKTLEFSIFRIICFVPRETNVMVLR